MASALLEEVVIRREFRPGDDEVIPELHDRIYAAEHGLDARSRAWVSASVRRARERGWPERKGGLWIVERGREIQGTLALTHKDDEVGEVHWFVLVPELRGRGLGRAMLAELLAEARAAGLQRLELDTFSALRAAARLYREAGFRLVWEEQGDKWGPPLTFQGYELKLR